MSSSGSTFPGRVGVSRDKASNDTSGLLRSDPVEPQVLLPTVSEHDSDSSDDEDATKGEPPFGLNGPADFTDSDRESDSDSTVSDNDKAAAFHSDDCPVLIPPYLKASLDGADDEPSLPHKPTAKEPPRPSASTKGAHIKQIEAVISFILRTEQDIDIDFSEIRFRGVKNRLPKHRIVYTLVIPHELVAPRHPIRDKDATQWPTCYLTMLPGWLIQRRVRVAVEQITGKTPPRTIRSPSPEVVKRFDEDLAREKRVNRIEKAVWEILRREHSIRIRERDVEGSFGGYSNTVKLPDGTAIVYSFDFSKERRLALREELRLLPASQWPPSILTLLPALLARGTVVLVVDTDDLISDSGNSDWTVDSDESDEDDYEGYQESEDDFDTSDADYSESGSSANENSNVSTSRRKRVISGTDFGILRNLSKLMGEGVIKFISPDTPAKLGPRPSALPTKKSLYGYDGANDTDDDTIDDRRVKDRRKKKRQLRSPIPMTKPAPGMNGEYVLDCIYRRDPPIPIYRFVQTDGGNDTPPSRHTRGSKKEEFGLLHARNESRGGTPTPHHAESPGRIVIRSPDGKISVLPTEIDDQGRCVLQLGEGLTVRGRGPNVRIQRDPTSRGSSSRGSNSRGSNSREVYSVTQPIDRNMRNHRRPHKAPTIPYPGPPRALQQVQAAASRAINEASATANRIINRAIATTEKFTVMATIDETIADIVKTKHKQYTITPKDIRFHGCPSILVPRLRIAVNLDLQGMGPAFTHTALPQHAIDWPLDTLKTLSRKLKDGAVRVSVQQEQKVVGPNGNSIDPSLLRFQTDGAGDGSSGDKPKGKGKVAWGVQLEVFPDNNGSTSSSSGGSHRRSGNGAGSSRRHGHPPPSAPQPPPLTPGDSAGIRHGTIGPNLPVPSHSKNPISGLGSSGSGSKNTISTIAPSDSVSQIGSSARGSHLGTGTRPGTGSGGQIPRPGTAGVGSIPRPGTGSHRRSGLSGSGLPGSGSGGQQKPRPPYVSSGSSISSGSSGGIGGSRRPGSGRDTLRPGTSHGTGSGHRKGTGDSSGRPPLVLRPAGEDGTRTSGRPNSGPGGSSGSTDYGSKGHGSHRVGIPALEPRGSGSKKPTVPGLYPSGSGARPSFSGRAGTGGSYKSPGGRSDGLGSGKSRSGSSPAVADHDPNDPWRSRYGTPEHKAALNALEWEIAKVLGKKLNTTFDHTKVIFAGPKKILVWGSGIRARLNLGKEVNLTRESRYWTIEEIDNLRKQLEKGQADIHVEKDRKYRTLDSNTSSRKSGLPTSSYPLFDKDHGWSYPGHGNPLGQGSSGRRGSSAQKGRSGGLGGGPFGSRSLKSPGAPGSSGGSSGTGSSIRTPNLMTPMNVPGGSRNSRGTGGVGGGGSGGTGRSGGTGGGSSGGGGGGGGRSGGTGRSGGSSGRDGKSSSSAHRSTWGQTISKSDTRYRDDKAERKALSDKIDEAVAKILARRGITPNYNPWGVTWFGGPGVMVTGPTMMYFPLGIVAGSNMGAWNWQGRELPSDWSCWNCQMLRELQRAFMDGRAGVKAPDGRWLTMPPTDPRGGNDGALVPHRGAGLGGFGFDGADDRDDVQETATVRDEANSDSAIDIPSPDGSPDCKNESTLPQVDGPGDTGSSSGRGGREWQRRWLPAHKDSIEKALTESESLITTILFRKHGIQAGAEDIRLRGIQTHESRLGFSYELVFEKSKFERMLDECECSEDFLWRTDVTAWPIGIIQELPKLLKDGRVTLKVSLDRNYAPRDKDVDWPPARFDGADEEDGLTPQQREKEGKAKYIEECKSIITSILLWKHGYWFEASEVPFDGMVTILAHVGIKYHLEFGTYAQLYANDYGCDNDFMESNQVTAWPLWVVKELPGWLLREYVAIRVEEDPNWEPSDALPFNGRDDSPDSQGSKHMKELLFLEAQMSADDPIVTSTPELDTGIAPDDTTFLHYDPLVDPSGNVTDERWISAKSHFDSDSNLEDVLPEETLLPIGKSNSETKARSEAVLKLQDKVSQLEIELEHIQKELHASTLTIAESERVIRGLRVQLKEASAENGNQSNATTGSRGTYNWPHDVNNPEPSADDDSSYPPDLSGIDLSMIEQFTAAFHIQETEIASLKEKLADQDGELSYLLSKIVEQDVQISAKDESIRSLRTKWQSLVNAHTVQKKEIATLKAKLAQSHKGREMDRDTIHEQLMDLVKDIHGIDEGLDGYYTLGKQGRG